MITSAGVNAVSRWTMQRPPIIGLRMGLRTLNIIIAAGIASLAMAMQAKGKEAAQASGKAVPSAPAKAVPLASPAAWISPDDYPISAARAGETGTVGFELAVDDAGNVTECRVTRSSGSALLDERTCAILQMRAKFHPADTASGAAGRRHFASAVRWTLPRDKVPPRDLFVTGTFVVEKAGYVRDCRLVKFEPGEDKASRGDLAGMTKEHVERTFCGSHVNYEPYRDENGALVSKRVTMTQSVRTETLKD